MSRIVFVYVSMCVVRKEGSKKNYREGTLAMATSGGPVEERNKGVYAMHC